VTAPRPRPCSRRRSSARREERRRRREPMELKRGIEKAVERSSPR
jgi:hypothetical protein